jgi:hypothetical protein
MMKWLVVVVVACSAAPRTPFVYAMPAHVGDLVTDDAAFGAFARELRRDLEGRRTPTKDERFTLAMLDALEDRWGEAVAQLDAIRAAEQDPRARAMTGLTIRVWADARAHGDEFRVALERVYAQLPVELVRSDLEMLRTMGTVFTRDVCRKLVEDALAGHAQITFDDAQAIVFQHYAVVRLVPVGAAIDAVLGGHGIGVKTP